MKTNYNNLTKFEACIVFVAVVGIALIGLEFYAGLSAQTRTQVAAAFEVFDLHSQFNQVSSMAETTIAVTNDFYNQFDIAFTQVFSFPDAIGTPLIQVADSFGSYAEAVASNYHSSYVAQTQMQGRVLGASLISQQAESVVQQTQSTAVARKHYDYLAPSFVPSLK